MRTVRLAVYSTFLPLFLFGGALLSSGCGGSKDGEVLKPEAPPSTTNKASMDYYKSQMKTKSGKAKKH